MRAYATAESSIENDGIKIVIALPYERIEDIDELILHELQRAVVTYVLMKWYSVRDEGMARNEERIFEASVREMMHDIRLAYGGRHRHMRYF